MRTKVRIINGERYVPVSKKLEKLLIEAGVQLYKIGNLKTLFAKVNIERR